MGKRTAEFVLGLIGGILGFFGGLFILVLGGLGKMLNASGASTISSFGWFGLLFAVLGIVGSVIVGSKYKLGGWLMLISAVGGVISLRWAYSLSFILLTISGLTALIRKSDDNEVKIEGQKSNKSKQKKQEEKKKSSKKVFWFVIGGIVLIIFINALFIAFFNEQKQENKSSVNSVKTSSESSAEEITYSLGERFVWGDFAYTFHNVETESEIGSYLFGEFYGEKADGMFLVVDVTIENIDKETQTFWGSAITITDDKGRIFEDDDNAWIYLDDDVKFIFEQMQPNLPKKGKIIFDVPKDINGKIRISKGLFSSKYVYISLS